MDREKVQIEQVEQIQVIDRNKQNFVMIEHFIMDSLYFDNIYQKMVYLNLKRFANWHTQESFPSVPTLAKLSYCGETKVKTTIKELEKKQLIQVKERYEGKRQLSNLYIILEYPLGLLEMDYRNEGGRVVTPSGSQDAPHGVASCPPRGRVTPTKEKELNEKDLDEKDSIEKELENLKNIIKNEEEEKEFFSISKPLFIEFHDHFKENYPDTFDYKMFEMIYKQMLERKLEFILPHEAEIQYKKMEEIGQENIRVYASYFVGGIILNRTSKQSAKAKKMVIDAKKKHAAEKAKKKNEENKNPLPFYNWLEA